MLTYDAHAPTPDILVGGRSLPLDMAQNVVRIEVEHQRSLPTSCVVELIDAEGDIVDAPMLLPGAELVVKASPATEDPSAVPSDPIFDGEIVALELSLPDAGGARVLLRGYDRGHRLHRRTRTQTFLQQSDGDVARSLADDHGLAVSAGTTRTVHEYLCQHDQTDWAFLTERAREIGFEVAVVGRTLHFHRAGARPGATGSTTLERGDELLVLRARASSAAQPSETSVRGFDAVRKEPVVGLAGTPTLENEPGDGALLPDRIADGFGSAEAVEPDHPLRRQEVAEEYATAVRAHLGTTAYEADGTCIGNPSIRAGTRLELAKVGRRFAGTFVVSRARHVFDGSGYLTHFSVCGMHDRSLLGLTRPGTANGAALTARPMGQTTPVTGTVTDTTDPLGIGRVRVTLPWLDEQAVTDWAPVVSVGAGAERGLQCTPEIDDLVVVVFEHGDVRRPLVLGGLWNEPDPPPEAEAVVDGQTEVRVLRTRTGHVLRFDDTAGSECVELTTHEGSTLRIREGDGAGITLTDKGGENRVHIDADANTVTVASAGDLVVDATGNLQLKAGGDLELSATGDVKLQGRNVDAAAQANATLDGGAGTTVSSSASVTVRGALVKIN